MPFRARSRPVSPAASPFAEQVLPHLDAAYSLARWLVRDATAAEDVVQTAMLRALGHFSSFRGENPRAWLLAIVRNAAYSWLGERRRDPEALAEDTDERQRATPDSAPDPEAMLARTEDRARLERLLATLPAELRECLVLRELEEMTYQEIATVTAVPIGTVMSRLWRARRILMKQVERSELR
jgi:RNA polymerase sigma-70 factor, ECF subfamily